MVDLPLVELRSGFGVRSQTEKCAMSVIMPGQNTELHLYRTFHGSSTEFRVQMMCVCVCVFMGELEAL